MEFFTLYNGVKMPAIGCGTVNYGREGRKLENPLNNDFTALDSAIELGYRLFDTALAYGNEEGIGEHLQKSGVPRDELFISSKVPNYAPYNVSPQSVRDSVCESMRRLRTDYLDMLLIHHAVPPKAEAQGLPMDLERTAEVWLTFDALMKEGKLRGIGVSNFNIEQLDQLMDATGVKPMVNQVRCNPAIQNLEIVEYCKSIDILPEAHSPLNFTVARDKKVEDPEYKAKLVEIGEKYGKSWAQVILRYNYQNGMCSVPGSFNPANQLANLSIFDFELSSEEMAALTR